MATTISKTFLVKSTQDFSIPSSSFGLLTGSLAEQQQILGIVTPVTINHGSGSIDSRPVSPGPGDTFIVNTGTGSYGDAYECFQSGTWTLTKYDRIRQNDSPYLWWGMTESSGYFFNSGSGGIATLTGSSISDYNTALWSLPIRGARFGGSSKATLPANVAVSGISGSTAWTIAAWVLPRDTTLSSYRTVCALDYNTGAFSQPYVSVGLAQSPSGVRAWITTTAQTGTGQEVTATSPLLLNSGPRHLVARFNGTALQVVIDGIQRATSNTTGGVVAIGPAPIWTVGHQYDGQEYWNGEIADVRVYVSESKSNAWCYETWARGVGAYTGS